MFTCKPFFSSLTLVIMSLAGMAHAADDAFFHAAPEALGKSLTVAQVSLLPQHVFADGQGLPQGRGTADLGQAIYTERCASCHGGQGQGGRALELVGDRDLLATEYPDRGIAVYWPYAPSLYEYVYRSMPPDSPASLSPDELYSLLAHVLVLNKLIEPETVVDADVLRSLVMPNVNGFRTVGR